MKTQTAFTIIELMVALVLAALLVIIALPSLKNILLNNKMTTKSVDFVRALNYTRGEAISRAITMSIEANDESGDWGKGWRIVDKSKDQTPVMDDEDDRIRTQIKYDDEITIIINTGPPDLSAIQYDSRGRLISQETIRFWVCSKNNPHIEGRQVTIRPIGSVSIERGSQYQCK